MLNEHPSIKLVTSISFGSLHFMMRVLGLWLAWEMGCGIGWGSEPNPTPAALSLEEVRARFMELRKQSGTLTVQQYVDICRPKNKFVVKRKDLRPAWESFVALLKPPVTKNELKVLHEALGQSILDVRVVYDYQARGVIPQGEKRVLDERREFARAGASVLAREESQKKAALHYTAITAYDGEVIRQLQRRDDGLLNAAIVPFNGRSRFYHTDSNPLLLAMLVDCVATLNMHSTFLDLTEFLNIDTVAVLEERREVDGRNCIVVGNPDLCVYLDPDRNFCVTKVEVLQNGPKEDSPPVMRIERHLRDFHDYKNGLWFPHKIINDRFDNTGQVTFHETVNVIECHINEGISKEYFSNIIPKGAKVIDSIRGTIYRVGKSGSIAEMLDETANAPTKFRLSPILLISNLIALTMLLVTLLIRRRISGATNENRT